MIRPRVRHFGLVLLLVCSLAAGGCRQGFWRGSPWSSHEISAVKERDPDRINIWPLLYKSKDTFSILGPLFTITPDSVTMWPFFDLYDQRRNLDLLMSLIRINRVKQSGWILPLLVFWNNQENYVYSPFFGWDKTRRYIAPFMWGGTAEGRFFHVLPILWTYWAEKSKSITLFPLLWWKKSPDVGRFVLFPFIWWKREAESRRFTLFPLVWWRADPGDRRLTIFPFIWSRRSAYDTHLHVVPFFWWSKDRFLHVPPVYYSTPRYRSVLWPFMRWYQVNERWVFASWPFFQWNRSGYSYVLWPLYHRWPDAGGHSNFLPLPLPTWWRDAPQDKAGVVFPVLWWGKSPRRGYLHVLPFFSYSRDNVRKRILSPFFAWFEDKDRKLDWLSILWLPYNRIRNRQSEQTTHITPLGLWSSGPNKSWLSVGWLFYNYYRIGEKKAWITPLGMRLVDKAKDLDWLSVGWLPYNRIRRGKRTTHLTPLFSWTTGPGRNWFNLGWFLYNSYGDDESKFWITPLGAGFRDPDRHWLNVGWVLFNRYRSESRNRTVTVTPLFSWGHDPGKFWWASPVGFGTYSSRQSWTNIGWVLFNRFRSDTKRTVITPLVSWSRDRDPEAKAKWTNVLGVFHHYRDPDHRRSGLITPLGLHTRSPGRSWTNIGWVLYNRIRRGERVQNVTPLLFWGRDPGLLFATPAVDFQDDLDKGVLSQELRDEFKKHKIDLPDLVAISSEEAGRKWRISAKGVNYIIHKKDETVNIYGTGRSWWASPVGFGTYTSRQSWTNVGWFLFNRVRKGKQTKTITPLFGWKRGGGSSWTWVGPVVQKSDKRGSSIWTPVVGARRGKDVSWFNLLTLLYLRRVDHGEPNRSDGGFLMPFGWFSKGPDHRSLRFWPLFNYQYHRTDPRHSSWFTWLRNYPKDELWDHRRLSFLFIFAHTAAHALQLEDGAETPEEFRRWGQRRSIDWRKVSKIARLNPGSEAHKRWKAFEKQSLKKLPYRQTYLWPLFSHERLEGKFAQGWFLFSLGKYDLKPKEKYARFWPLVSWRYDAEYSGPGESRHHGREFDRRELGLVTLTPDFSLFRYVSSRRRLIPGGDKFRHVRHRLWPFYSYDRLEEYEMRLNIIWPLGRFAWKYERGDKHSWSYFFPLWSYDHVPGRTTKFRLLWQLYRFDRNAEEDKVDARVLWKLFHYHREGDWVSVDLPLITYDRVGKREKHVSFLWRLFRYQRVDGEKKLYLIFIRVAKWGKKVAPVKVAALLHAGRPAVLLGAAAR